MAVECDVAHGMARDLMDLEDPVADAGHLAGADPLGGGGDALVVRADHGQAGKMRDDAGHAADVVVVVVGQQDAAQLQARGHRGEHGARFAGVDDEPGAAVVLQRPDVVVLECRQRSKSHRIVRLFQQNRDHAAARIPPST